MIDPNNITTVRVDELPPDAIGLNDLIPFETIADQALKKMPISDFIAFIALQTSALQYEVKRMSVTQAYIDANFDVTGLGVNICAGFAICNGQNGTENLDGRVGVGYGAVQSNIGGFGGEKEHVLTIDEMPTHNHDVPYNLNDAGGAGAQRTLDNSGVSVTYNQTVSEGGGEAHNNMQPYIVQLYMMKL